MSQRPVDQRLLDAARELVLDVGVRRTTAADVARGAGVSRATLYRSFPDVAALVGALIERECGELFDRALAETAALETARERLVEATVMGVEQLARDPLLARVLRLDPERLLPYVTDRLGSTQRRVIGLYERFLGEGRADGSIRPLDARSAAYCLQIAAQGFVFSARIAEAEGLRSQSFAELRALLDRYLRPEPG